MAKKKRKKKAKKTVTTLTHDEASRKNIPTAEFQSVMDKKEQSPLQVAYERCNRDLGYLGTPYLIQDRNE